MHVNYLIMAHNKVDTRRALINAYNQIYSNELKTIYILYQEPFPEHIKYNLDIEIVQINVECSKKNTWWMKKVLAYCDNVKNIDSITIIFDEDDIYEPYYTKKVVEKFKLHDVLWNYDMILMDNESIRYSKWGNAISTLVINTKKFQDISYKIAKIYPDLSFNRGEKPLDGLFTYQLGLHTMMHNHDGVKAYFITTSCNTSALYTKWKERSIDFEK